jgi:cellobiose phosphorylase
MKFGYFDDASREYVITNPRLPVKWINYIGTLAFGGYVDHTGGGVICKGDPALNRLTFYLIQLPAASFNGETLYLRFKRGQETQSFSPFFVPTLDPYESFECRVGLGYTRFITEFYHIRSEITVFVPLAKAAPGVEACVIRKMRFTNLGTEPLELDAIPVVEYSHPDALKQLTNADWIPQTMQSQAVLLEGGCTALVQYPFMLRDTCINYFTSNQPASSYDTDRRRFLGENEYRTWADPAGLEAPELSSSQARRGSNIAALMHHLGVLGPGEERSLVTLLGQETSLNAARPVIDRFRKVEAVDQALDELGAGWQERLERQQVKTPDAGFNSMLNIHNPRQCMTTLNWSRYLSLYQPGFGARGIGYRDSSQDVMGVLPIAPREGRDMLANLMQVQKRDGSAMHQFNPLTMAASVGDAAERDDRPQYYSDDALWGILAVCAYLKETGDFAFLDRRLPYYEKDRNEQPLETGAVLEHMARALEFTRRSVGAHGLPLLGFADWNDTVNLPAGSESTLTACLYGKALLEMAALARWMGDGERERHYAAGYEKIKDAFNRHAWDGSWYVAYFNENGEPVGSQVNQAGQIYVYPQAWAVIAGFASPERASLALEAVYQRLNTRRGIKLSAPGYNGFDPHQGGITTYPPGAKENGGIFLHTNPWVIAAETLLRHGARANEYYAQINPALANDRGDEFETEPYAYPQNILGDEHPQFGLARNSWLTGTAAWMYLTGSQSILGVQPDYDGLHVDPCIPADWPGFEVGRIFRGARYTIRVQNPLHLCCGVNHVKVDGMEIMGDKAPAFSDGGEHVIEVVLGE